jgi:hypothetical protein
MPAPVTDWAIVVSAVAAVVAAVYAVRGFYTSQGTDVRSRRPIIHVAFGGGGGGSKVSLQLWTTGGSSPACVVVGRFSNQIYAGTYSIGPGTALTYRASLVGPAPAPAVDAILVLLAEDVARDWWDSFGKKVGRPHAAAKRLREDLARLGLQGFESTIMPPELIHAAEHHEIWLDRFRRAQRR